MTDENGYPEKLWIRGDACPTCGRRPRKSGWTATHDGKPFDEYEDTQRAFDHAVERLIAAAEDWQWCDKADEDLDEPLPEEVEALQALSDASTLVAVINVILDELEDKQEVPADE